MGDMAYWEHDILLKPCKFPLSQPNSIILELGQILLSWRCIGPKEGESSGSSLQDVRRIFLWASSSDHGSPSLFEEKVHKRSFRELIAFPLLFQGCYAKFGASGIPSEPQLEKSEFASSTSCSASSQPSTSAEPRMAIPISEYRELCRALETLTASQSSLAQEMAAIRACQEQMLATQAQQAAILRQLQVHFDLPQAVEPSTDTPAEPHSHPSDKEVPLPPFNYSHSYHIEDNAQFGWGE
ncbi:hypothetical protein CK203_058209 [Vitis vinifera]|uniref:Uncharacterized protein n=1 Tax=Vitis vinifera TaxID=29760 RepID=A0A438H5N7_VITVI|nr:hypothetical protein CK203_058209 [Vitis vinifera]